MSSRVISGSITISEDRDTYEDYQTETVPDGEIWYVEQSTAFINAELNSSNSDPAFCLATVIADKDYGPLLEYDGDGSFSFLVSGFQSSENSTTSVVGPIDISTNVDQYAYPGDIVTVGMFLHQAFTDDGEGQADWHYRSSIRRVA